MYWLGKPGRRKAEAKEDEDEEAIVTQGELHLVPEKERPSFPEPTSPESSSVSERGTGASGPERDPNSKSAAVLPASPLEPSSWLVWKLRSGEREGGNCRL